MLSPVDLVIASFGREFRLYGTFDAGTNDLVAGSATPLWTSKTFSANNNSSGNDFVNTLEIPDGRVDIRAEATIVAGQATVLTRGPADPVCPNSGLAGLTVQENNPGESPGAVEPDLVGFLAEVDARVRRCDARDLVLRRDD